MVSDDTYAYTNNLNHEPACLTNLFFLIFGTACIGKKRFLDQNNVSK